MNIRKITLILLILLTIASAIIAQSTSTYTEIAILVLAGLKFVGIAYIFMDINKAHSFWKTAILIYTLIIVGVVIIII